MKLVSSCTLYREAHSEGYEISMFFNFVLTIKSRGNAHLFPRIQYMTFSRGFGLVPFFFFFFSLLAFISV